MSTLATNKEKKYVGDYAHLLAEWDWEENNVSPYSITYGSAKECFWKCLTCGYRWKLLHIAVDLMAVVVLNVHEKNAVNQKENLLQRRIVLSLTFLILQKNGIQRKIKNII